MKHIEFKTLTNEQQEKIRELIKGMQMALEGKGLFSKNDKQLVYEDINNTLFKDLDCCEKKSKLVKWYKLKTINALEMLCNLFDNSSEIMPIRGVKKMREDLMEGVNC